MDNQYRNKWWVMVAVSLVLFMGTIDGTIVTTSSEFLERIAALAPGQRTRLTLFRAGRELDVDVTAGRRPAVQDMLRR